MNTKILVGGLCLMNLFVAISAPAQSPAPNLFQIVISGNSWTTNESGHIESSPLNNHTLLQQLAQIDGVSDYSWWGLAYHVGGNELGDTIDVINRTNGTVLTTLFGLYFGESFGRLALLSASHKQMKRIEYIYTTQNSHSLGSAFLTDYYFFDGSGHTNNIVILGQMQYLVLPDSTHPGLQVATASFTTVRPWTFNGSH